MLGKTFASVVALWGLLALASAHAQNTYTPPRNVEDILAVLEQYKPDAVALQKARVGLEHQPPANANPSEIAFFYRERSGLATSLGLITQSIADAQLAVKHVTKGTWDEPTMIFSLAKAESEGGNRLTATKHWENIANWPGITPGRALVANARIASQSAEFGDITYAKDALARATSLMATNSSIRENMAWHRHNFASNFEFAKASVRNAAGKLADAEASYVRAIAEYRNDIPFNRMRAARGMDGSPPTRYEAAVDELEMKLAENLLQQGKLTEAEQTVRNLLQRALQRSGRYSAYTGSALVALARIVAERGRYADAVALAIASIDIYQRVGAPPESQHIAEARRIQGRALVAQSHWADAAKVFEDMNEGVLKDPLLAQKLGTGDIDWGVALVRTGQAARAVTMLDDLLKRDTGRLGETNGQVAEIRGHLAIALAAAGERERALVQFRRALPILLDRAYAERASEEGGIARATRLTRVLEAYLDLLAESGASTEDLAESFRIADIARSSQVQRALSTSAARAAITDPQLTQLAREEQDAATRLGVLTSLLSRLLASPPAQQLPKVIAGIRQEIETLRAARVRQTQDLERRFPDYSNLIDPKPATLEQARAALRAGEALISIYVSESKTYVWAVPQQGAPTFAVVPLGEKGLTETVTELRKALDIGNAAIARFPRFDTGLAHRLYNDLLKPVEAGWKDATSLIIVPHRALGQLPFSLLVTAPTEAGADATRFDGYRAVPWLIRKAAVTQLPSVNALATLRALPALTGNRREFIGFGDPYFSKIQAAQATGQERIQVAALSANLRNLKIGAMALPMAGEAPDPEGGKIRNAPNVANSATLAQLARLPDTADEIRDIAQALKADMNKDVFLGVQANEKNVKGTNLADYKVVAFATHGLIPGDLNGLEQPALALTAPDVAGIDGDGLLTMEEILALKLNADWVVLSACNTGSGDGAGSEAVSGLGRAFFYAGARSLLVSNWPVETVSAKLLTTDVFKRSAENPTLTRAEALRQTMLWLMDNAGQRDASGKMEFTYAHPMFWAPFALIGDGAR